MLIDANILLDVLQARKPFVDTSSAVWKLCETEQAEGYVPTLTIANLIYIMRKELDSERIEHILNALGLIFSFTELTPTDLVRAAALRWNDFEDAVQSVTAERIGVDYIITRNVNDFSDSKTEAVTPAVLIAKIQEPQV